MPAYSSRAYLLNIKQLAFYLFLSGLLGLSACTSKLIAPVLWQKNSQQQTTPTPSQPEWHTVVLGENLFVIAQKYNQHYKTLAQWNRIRPPYTIYPNQRLRVAPAKTQPLVQPKLRQMTQQKTPAEPLPSSHSCMPPPYHWQWPTQAYRYQKTFTRTGRQGLNLFGYRGQGVYASEAGTVIYSGQGVNGYQGGLIIIQHNPAYLSIYAQNEKIWVQKNQRVQRGQRIANMGMNPQQQAHLHFEISCYQKTVPPLRYLSQG